MGRLRPSQSDPTAGHGTLVHEDVYLKQRSNSVSKNLCPEGSMESGTWKKGQKTGNCILFARQKLGVNLTPP